MVGFLQMNGGKMNGQHPPQQDYRPPAQGHAPLSPDTPLAFYTPIAITPNTIKWVFAAIVAGLTLMPAGLLDRYLMPARQSEVDTISAVVKLLQQGQTETAEAVKRLTLAVDNLSGIVEGVRNAQQAVRIVAPKAKR